MWLARSSASCARAVHFGLSTRPCSSSNGGGGGAATTSTPYVTPEEKRGQFRVLDIGLRPAKVATPRGRRGEREMDQERMRRRGMVQEPVKPQDR